MNLTQLARRTLETRWAAHKSVETSWANAQAVVVALGETLDVRKLTGAQVQDAVVAWRTEGLAPATINRRLSALSAMMQTAISAGIEPKISSFRFPWQKEPQGRVRVLSRAEQADLFSHLPYRSAELATFLVETGLRVGEAFRLIPKDLSVKGFVVVHHSKSGKARRVPLTEKALVAFCKPWPGSYTEFLRDWYNALAAAGLTWDKELVPHCLRHTCASRLLAAEANLVEVKEWLGHSNIQTTMRYAHLAGDALSVLAKRMETV